MAVKNKVVLFYPRYDGPPLSAPACLLALASPLLDAGYRVAVIDAALGGDFEGKIAREVADPETVCLGISVLTGPMIRGAIRVARRTKQQHPHLPVIFGGWHPTLLPEQTLQPDFVDAIVRGQGELTFVEVVQRLAHRDGLEGVRGTSHKSNGKVVNEAERPVVNINQLPLPAYHLADHDAYARICGVRKLAYATSVGCPYACHYCTDQVFYNRRFNALTASRTVAEMVELAQRYRAEEIALLDSNFPVDVHRAVAVARGILNSGVRFRWTFQASTDFLCRMSDEEVQVLAASGVTHMGFGTESASLEVLALMNKKHQRIDQMYETARKAQGAGIHLTFNLIFGYPGETEADRIETFRIMGDIARQFWNVSFSPNIFTPYPGIDIWPQLRALGVREPQTLEEWVDLPLGQNVLPWLQGEELRRLRSMLEFFLLHNQIRKATKNSPWLRTGLRRMLTAPVRWRVRTNHLAFPWELWLARGAEKLVTRRSLLTGQPLGHSMDEVC
jgi:anaerobic magnesium-protoporphyrin IX monomethyl ester cyclase